MLNEKKIIFNRRRATEGDIEKWEISVHCHKAHKSPMAVLNTKKRFDFLLADEDAILVDSDELIMSSLVIRRLLRSHQR